MSRDRLRDAQALLADGQSSLDRADFRAALESFSRAIELRPDVEGYRARARAYNSLGQRSDALNDLDRAVRLNPREAGLYAERAELLFRQHAYDLAVADCGKLLALDPGNAAVLALRGDCFAAQGSTGAALADYAKAFDAATEAPFKADVLRRRASLQLDCEDYAQAVADCDAALALDPSLVAAYRLRGMAHRGAGDLAAAEADLSLALEREADSPLTTLARATVRFDLGQVEGAVEDCTTALDRDPADARALTLRGLAHRRLGKHDEALADFTRAIQLSPDQPAPRNWRAGVYYQKGDYGRAVQDHLDALKCDPRNPATFNQLGWLWATAPDPDVRNGKQARECATRACELTEFQEASYLDTLAAAYAECGEFDDAVRWQQKAQKIAPPEQAEGYAERLGQYERRKPYRAGAGRG